MPKQRGQLEIALTERPYGVAVIRNVDGHDVPTTYGMPGSYVDTHEWYKNILISLVSISERNQRRGLAGAAYNVEYRSPIVNQYGYHTDDVVDGASRNRNMYHHQLRESFWRATGYGPMRELVKVQPEVYPGRLINGQAQTYWERFNRRFADPKELSDRRRYQKLMVKGLGNRELAAKVITMARAGDFVDKERARKAA
jgi:hypothetical protein